MVTMSYWPAPLATSAVTALRRSPSSMTWKLTVVPGLAFSYSVLSFSMSFIWPLFTVARFKVTLPPEALPLPEDELPAPEQAPNTRAEESAKTPSVNVRLVESILTPLVGALQFVRRQRAWQIKGQELGVEM
jgi:hypothetical protein